MNIKKSNITFLILLLLAMIMLTACGGGKPAEVPATTPNAAQPSPTITETAPVPAPVPEAPAEESKPAEVTAAKTPEAKPVTEATSNQTAAKPAEAPTQPSPEANSSLESSYNGALDKPIAEQPVLLTSSGQSADVQMVKVLLDRAEIKYVLNSVVKPEEIKDVKTLILAVGGSSKGLGAAGIDAEDELARTKTIISKAKELNLKIISLHIGGEARRGELSDKFINASIPDSDYVIVVEEGNKDNLFTKLTDANKIPMDKVKKITEAVEPLKSAFK